MSSGSEAIELAAQFGLVLDSWQQWTLAEALGERPDGRWSAFEVGLLCPRQNGKGSILEARELAGLLLFGEKHLTHSAHEAKTSKDHFNRMEALLRAGGYDESKVIFKRSNQEVSIEIRSSGAKLQFYTRTADGGRGLGGDLVVLDEAYALTDDQLAALMPTMAARSLMGNPQMWFTSSAGFPYSHVLQRVRERGERGDDRLAYFDWSADPDADLDDRQAWAVANPGLGLRISEDFIESELGMMSERQFARERLGIWHDPKTIQVVEDAEWSALDSESAIVGPVVFAVAAEFDRSQACIAVCGLDADGVPKVEVAKSGNGVAWAGPELVAMMKRNPEALAVQLDAGSPAGTLLAPLEAAGVTVWNMSTNEVKRACAGFVDAVRDSDLLHSPDPMVAVAIQGAARRKIGSFQDAWAWGRKDTVNICPLVAETYAWFGWINRHAHDKKKTTYTGKVWC